MIRLAKRLAAGILTAMILVTNYSFSLSASSVETVSDTYTVFENESADEESGSSTGETPDEPGDPSTGETPSKPYQAPSGATIYYRTRARKKKFEKKYKSQGALSGSVGKARTLDSFQVKISSSTPGQVKYRAHIYKRGWTSYKTQGKTAGRKNGKLDQIQIYLTGELAKKYDIYYRVKIRITNGWMDWAKNGESAGAIHYARFIEAIQVVLTEKGAGSPGNLGNIAPQREGALLTANHIMKAMTEKAQSMSSITKWLILCDTGNYFAGVFKGSQGNWKMVRFIYIGVGKAKTPTKKGKFRLRKKKKNLYGYGVRCLYACSFKGAYYFHSIPYYYDGKTVFSPVLGKQISHGCVRMATDDAKYIYKKVPLKTSVWVY